MIKQYRADSDIEELEDTSELADVIKTFNKLVASYNFINKSLSIQSNFDGYIAENVVVPSTGLKKISIQHFLGVKPKWRIILRQEGNGVITDIPSEWNDKVITLYNNGSVDVTLTVFIVRE